jgi:hypothetical protein
MIHRVVIFQATGLLLLLPVTAGPAQAQNADPKPRAAIAAWDAVQWSATPFGPVTRAAQARWTPVPTGKTLTSFRGDAAITNGRILVLARQKSPTVEVYTVGTDEPVSRVQLTLLAGSDQQTGPFHQAALVEHTRAAACLDVCYKTLQGTEIAARLRLKRGDVYLEVEPKAGAARMRVECPSRYVVLPDFFADDLVIDPSKFPGKAAEVPSENFVLHLTGKEDAIAACVFENRDQDVQVTFSGQDDQRTVTGSLIDFGKGRKVWVALLEAPHIWHTLQVADHDTGQIKRLDWKMPFPAAWRCDLTRTNGLVDSWEMLLQEAKDGDYIKPRWLGSGEERLGANRRRWTTVLGSFPYPCWSDSEGQGYLQPLKHQALQFRGPMVIYPINRVRQTPLEAYTVVDVMRNTLGVGPCAYILDLEGQKSEYKGRATCSVRDKLGDIYSKHQQQQQRAEVEKTLDEGLIFVTHIRGRITRYVEFGRQLRTYLAEQQKVHPETHDFLKEMDHLAAEIDARVAARTDKIKTPAHVAAMNEEFRKNVLGDDGPDALAKCKEYTKALVVIGDNQDELSGECRWVVKSLRQQAGLRMALDPKVAPIARAIRAKAQETLRNPANHEGARH